MRRKKTPIAPAGDQGKPAPSMPFISPKELASRWRCGRSSVDRIARIAGMTRLCLGDGKNGTVRYLLKEVVDYEQSRMIAMR